MADKKTPEKIVEDLRRHAKYESGNTEELLKQAADTIEDLQKKPEVKKDTLITNQ